MNSYWPRNRNRWVALMSVFGIGPLGIYLALISPAIQSISGYQNRIKLHIGSPSLSSFGTASASAQELEQLEQVKKGELARVKRIDSRDSLLRFSGSLADALASRARSYGLRVMSVDLRNSLIKGRYVPADEHALDLLTGWPGPQWSELADPLDLPMLKVPSVELDITVASEYSRVFAFIESLPEFPALVSLASLNVVDDPVERPFRLRIRGYYYRSGDWRSGP